MNGPEKRTDLKAVRRWTFVTNHALVLLFVARHPRITAREISLKLEITERAVRKVIADLKEAGYIKITREGRTVEYVVNHVMSMRHPTQREVAVGDFLKKLKTISTF
ncbi:MAG: helix-turn-helix domain-containing protein [Proteobacteria bacterium]|nr:helix-turn-helix domain-containing protein [Pseudomonadota bacterium]